MKNNFTKLYTIILLSFSCIFSAQGMDTDESVSTGLPISPYPPGWLPSVVVNTQTQQTHHSPVPEYWREILRIKDDIHLLRNIARTITIRPHEMSMLTQKVCTHEEPIYRLWKVKKWQQMNTQERDEAIALMEQTARVERQKAKNLVSRTLQKDRFSYVLPIVSTKLEQYVPDLVNTGDIELVMILFQNPDMEMPDEQIVHQAPTVRFAIRITKTYHDHLGILATKDHGGHVTETNSSKLMLTIGVDEIIQNLSERREWNHDRDGKITTLCTTS